MLNKHIGVLATSSELFGLKKTNEEIKELVQKLPLLSLFILLSQISTGTFNEKSLKSHFIEEYRRALDKDYKNNTIPSPISDKVYERLLLKLKRLESSVAFSQQSMLNIWKWLLAFGSKENIDKFQNDTELNISTICYLSLMTNDHLYNGKSDFLNLYAGLFSNIVFNNREDVANEISRTFIIYAKIAQKKELYNTKEFLDINKDFHIKYGYTIKQHIATIFALIGVFMKPKVIGGKWLQNIDEIFSNTALNSIAKKIISSLTTDIFSISDWAMQKLESEWDFQAFREKPLLMVNDKQFLPFSLKLLYEQLFKGLFHKVRHIYPLDDEKFLGFFGRPFEKYVQLLAKEAIGQTKLPYELYPDFVYGKSKRSPDLILKLENKILAIEVKSYRLLLPSIIEADVISIKNDTNRMIIKPLKQVHDRVKELMEDRHKIFDGVTDIYLMVVTQGHFPTLKPYELKIEQELKSHFEIKLKGYFHVDIEEFEMLSKLLERRRPIFRVLENKNKEENKHKSFKNFCFDNSLHVKRTKFIEDQYSTATEEIQSILF